MNIEVCVSALNRNAWKLWTVRKGIITHWAYTFRNCHSFEISVWKRLFTDWNKAWRKCDWCKLLVRKGIISYWNSSAFYRNRAVIRKLTLVLIRNFSCVNNSVRLICVPKAIVKCVITYRNNAWCKFSERIGKTVKSR